MKEYLTGTLSALREQAVESFKQRNIWQIRLPILVFLIYIWVQHVRDFSYWSIFGALNLGIHELGHFVFRPFGMFMSILGGSLLQCLIPLGSVIMFYRQRDFFAIAFAFGWLATNFFYVAYYVADARATAIQLVSVGGGEVIHDWNYILGQLGMLPMDSTIAFLLRCAGSLSMFICAVGGSWVLWKMYKAQAAQRNRS